MTTCLGKGCSFGLLEVSFVSVCSLYVFFPVLGFGGGSWIGFDCFNSRSLPFFILFSSYSKFSSFNNKSVLYLQLEVSTLTNISIVHEEK